MPSRSAAALSPPVTLEVALELLRGRGVGVARKRLQQAAAAVVKANNSTRLSAEALRVRFEPGPHRDPA